jgi:hypothetical protein
MADHYVFFGAEINPTSANNFIALLRFYEKSGLGVQ